jgi:hypothetical protein
MSVATIRAAGRSRAMEIATQPLPVQTSATLTAARGSGKSSSAASTISSVS